MGRSAGTRAWPAAYPSGTRVLSSGGFSEEAEIPGIKYILSPYKLNLVATPLFLKPGIPYSIKVDERGKMAKYARRLLCPESMRMANGRDPAGGGIAEGRRLQTSPCRGQRPPGPGVGGAAPQQGPGFGELACDRRPLEKHCIRSDVNETR